MLSKAIGAVGMILLMSNSASLAGEARTHDGFLLRLSAGPGYGETSIDPGEKIKMSGASGDMNIAIGGIVAPNLAVHGTLWGWLVSGPDVEVGSESGTANDANLSVSFFGGGITYYFMPINIYVSPSIGAAVGSIEEGNTTYETDTGFGLDLTLGKEWWVGDGWALGAAGAYSWHSVGEPNVDDKWSGSAFGVRFSATMN